MKTLVALLSAAAMLALIAVVAHGDDTQSIVEWGSRVVAEPSAIADLEAIAAGGDFNLGLRFGSIVAWGSNSDHQCEVPAPNSEFVAIAAGHQHAIGLKAGGTLLVWGRNDFGQLNLPGPNSDFIAVAGGDFHSLALKSDRSIVAWGRSGNGQCNVPLPNSHFIAISAGYAHSLGLKDDSTIVAWGDNEYGQCNVPVPNSGFIAVAAGTYHSIGLRANGTIVAWGYNGYGECNVPSPNSGFIKIAGKGNHTLALKSDSTLVAWGRNEYGQTTVPTPNTGFAAIAGGKLHNLGLKRGTVVAWGDNSSGQCTVPPRNQDITAIAAGVHHTLGLKANRSVVAWGANSSGQCNVPAPNANFAAISGGGSHSMGLTTGGSIVVWGSCSFGLCSVPAPNSDFIAIAAGGYHCLGLKSNGTIVAWGGNSYGECNVPAPDSDFIAISASWQHSLGLRNDGTIVGWGRNDHGEGMGPVPNGNFVSVSAGLFHNLGLKADGSVVVWGDNGVGQYNIPPPNADFVAIAAGWQYNLGLKANGVIVAWGYNGDGRCSIPSPNIRFVDLSAGELGGIGLKRPLVVGTALTLSSSQNPSLVGQPITLTATILPHPPQGTVQFFDSGASIGTVAFSGAAAALVYAPAVAGNRVLSATFLGDSVYLASTGTLAQDVSTGPTSSTSIASTANPSFSLNVNFTASVTPVPHGGTLTFSDDDGPLATLPLVNGAATLAYHATRFFSDRTITASFSGELGLAPSSATYRQQFIGGGTTTVLTSSVNPATASQSFTLTATVSPASATGTVSFADSTTALGSAPLAGGVATMSLQIPLVASHLFSAAYLGDTTYSESSGLLRLEVVGIATASTLATNSSGAVEGSKVRLIATVTPPLDVGTVSFYVDSVVHASAPLTAGVATITTTTLPVGMHALTAEYSGGPIYGASRSSVVPYLVTPITDPYLRVLAPNDGETWFVGSPAQIQWDASSLPLVPQVSLYLSRTLSPPTWETIAEDVPNTGSYSWVVTGPGTNVGSTPVLSALVSVIDYSGTAGGDESDLPFSIVGPATTAVEERVDPQAFTLTAAWPNPTHGELALEFTVAQGAAVRVNVVDLAGREVAMLAQGQYAPGRYRLVWDGRNVTAGVYFVRYETPRGTFVRRAAILR